MIIYKTYKKEAKADKGTKKAPSQKSVYDYSEYITNDTPKQNMVAGMPVKNADPKVVFQTLGSLLADALRKQRLEDEAKSENESVRLSKEIIYTGLMRESENFINKVSKMKNESVQDNKYLLDTVTQWLDSLSGIKTVVILGEGYTDGTYEVELYTTGGLLQGYINLEALRKECSPSDDDPCDELPFDIEPLSDCLAEYPEYL